MNYPFLKIYHYYLSYFSLCLKIDSRCLGGYTAHQSNTCHHLGSCTYHLSHYYICFSSSNSYLDSATCHLGMGNNCLVNIYYFGVNRLPTCVAMLNTLIASNILWYRAVFLRMGLTTPFYNG
jgi:hypothetical protein